MTGEQGTNRASDRDGDGDGDGDDDGTMLFRDRTDAGQRLGDALRGRTGPHPMVLGIPRGGVLVAAPIATALGGDLGVVIARKIGAPMHEELAIGATTARGEPYIDADAVRILEVSAGYIERTAAREAAEAQRREAVFEGDEPPSPQGREVIVVDDGVATGATAIAALRSLHREGASRLVMATPVGAPEALERLRQEADAVVCLHSPADFMAVGGFYADFPQASDAEVRRALVEHAGGADLEA